MVLITFFLFCHFVWANPEGQSLSYQIGPLLNKTIQTSVEKAELIKVIVVMNRDHLKPLSEDLINELKNRIERLGGHIGDHAFNNVQVWISIDKVEELAKWGEIKLIRAPIRPQINSINSEGKDVIGATSWHNSGLTGKGVKLGVIDLGFSGYSSLLGSELPSDTQAVYTGSTSDFYSTEHGTVCAEIAYDMSPDAELYLVNVGDYDVAFHNAVSWLKLQNVNVISSSIGINLKTYCALLYEAQKTSFNYISSQINFLDNLKDQWDSTINSAINQGITWSQAAGNDGTKKWIGYFNDSDGDYCLNFTSYENYNEIELSNFEYGQEVYVLMMWGSDSEGYTSDDYDLYITNNSGNIVDYSEIDQDKFPLGIETCKFIPLHGVRYFVRVFQYRATPQKIGLLLGASQFPNFKHFTSGGTVRLFTPASNPNVITVGAVPYNNPYAIEPYSSQGPTVGGIIKPDLVAPDGVSTSSFGWHNFYGTSAAAPHVAGACALVKQAYPTWSPSQIKNYLEQNAQDLGESGKDNVYGSGLVQLPLNLPEPVHTETYLNVSGTPACYSSNGVHHVFTRGADGQLYEWWRSGSDWHTVNLSAVRWGVPIEGDPAALVIDGTPHVCARGAGGQLYDWWWEPQSGWHVANLSSIPWGVPIEGNPSCFAANGVQRVYARGMDNQLYEWWWTWKDGWNVVNLSNVPWGVWIAGDPSASPLYGTHHVFARSMDDQLHEWWWTWESGWHVANLSSIPWGKEIAGDPTSLVAGASLHVFGRGVDNQLYEWWWNADGWHITNLSTVPWGVEIAGDPSAISASGSHHVFARGVDNQLYEWWWEAESGWHVANLSSIPWGVRIGGDPASFSEKGIHHVFAQGTDGQLYEWWQDGGGWHITNLTQNAK